MGVAHSIEYAHSDKYVLYLQHGLLREPSQKHRLLPRDGAMPYEVQQEVFVPQEATGFD